MRGFLLGLVFTLALAPLATAAPVDGESAENLMASLPKLDATQRLGKGQVVGLFGGGLSLSTAGASRALVVGVSDAASGGSGSESMSAVVLSGRAAVNVVGAVRAGQLLFASGRNDGTALALPSSQITVASLNLLLGRALETGSGQGARTVSALVGLPQHELFSGFFEERDTLLEEQEVELAELNARIAQLEPLGAQVAELRRKTDQLMALEKARKSEQLAPPDGDG